MAAAPNLASATPYGAAAQVLGDALGSGGGPSSASQSYGAITGPTVIHSKPVNPVVVGVAALTLIALAALAASVLKPKKG